MKSSLKKTWDFLWQSWCSAPASTDSNQHLFINLDPGHSFTWKTCVQGTSWTGRAPSRGCIGKMSGSLQPTAIPTGLFHVLPLSSLKADWDSLQVSESWFLSKMGIANSSPLCDFSFYYKEHTLISQSSRDFKSKIKAWVSSGSWGRLYILEGRNGVSWRDRKAQTQTGYVMMPSARALIPLTRRDILVT